jgi:predicted DNA-binding transcriptional regulator AlpA
MRERFVGVDEIGKWFGISRRHVRQLISRADWPEPYEVLAMGKIWLREDIEAWAAEHRSDLPTQDGEIATP